MAVVSVEEKIGVGFQVNLKQQVDYTRTFVAVTDSRTDGPHELALATGIPRMGDVYARFDEVNLASVAKSKSVQQNNDNPLQWEIVVNYGPAEADEEQQNENPLLRPSDIRWDFAQFTKVAEHDINGGALLNSAGYHFDPPPEIDDSRPVLTITRNEAGFDPATAIDYQDAVNNDFFFGAAPGQAKIAKISGRRVVEGQYVYWQVTYEIHFRREGWILRVLDVGRHETGGKAIQAINASGAEQPGVYVTEPVPLNGSGQRLANPGPGNVTFRTFVVYRPMAFSGLLLP